MKTILLLLFPYLCFAQVTLTPEQVKVANGTFVYAVGCKIVKADCFKQLERDSVIMQLQKAQINALDSLYAVSGGKYQLCENDLTEAKKQAKKERFKRKMNAGLFYVSIAAAGVFAGLYFLTK